MRINTIKNRGFTLIELLVVIGIIGILAAIIMVSFAGATASARDARRKTELSQIGRMFVSTCYVPDAGAGDYDIATLAIELKNKYPQHANQIASMPRDPRIGSDTETHYRYIVSSDGQKCALYANLERESEPATLQISTPTPGGGTGVFGSSQRGANYTTKYFQVSN